MVLNENKLNMILSSFIWRGKKQIFKRKLTKYDVLDILLKFWTLGLTFVNIFLSNAENLCEASLGKQRQICIYADNSFVKNFPPIRQNKLKLKHNRKNINVTFCLHSFGLCWHHQSTTNSFPLFILIIQIRFLRKVSKVSFELGFLDVFQHVVEHLDGGFFF